MSKLSYATAFEKHHAVLSTAALQGKLLHNSHSLPAWILSYLINSCTSEEKLWALGTSELAIIEKLSRR